MQTVFSQRLLAGFRTLRDEENVRGGDPDDSIDPDISGPRLVVTVAKQSVEKIYTLPAEDTEQTSGRCPDTAEGSNTPESPPRARAAAAGTPAMPDLLDPVVLRTMPPRGRISSRAKIWSAFWSSLFAFI
jgi:hypothetical protein